MTVVPQKLSSPAAPRVATPTHSTRRGYLLVLIATVCWSTSGTFIRIILTNYAFTVWTLAFWRDILTFAVFLGIAILTRPTRLIVARRDLLPLAIMGAISIGIFHVLWGQAILLIPVAVATVLNYTAPVFVVLFAWLLWHEKPNQLQVTSLALAFLGCLLVTGAYDLSNVKLNWFGLLIGLLTGITYGTLTIIGKDALKRNDAWTVLTYAFGFGALTVFLLQPFAVWQALQLPSGAWLSVAALVLISTVAGFGFYTNGLKDLSAGSASITATLEPVIATGIAFVLLGEIIGPIQMLGGILVIAAVVLLARKA